MSKYRRAAKIDANQPGIVQFLRRLPGVTVEVGHDDILVGYCNRTFWFEIKEPGMVGKDGTIRESEKKDSQKRLEAEWAGHYRIVWDIYQILEEIGYATR